ncbi:MAG: hypothetical protein J2P17_30025 [Mycobacterium sp.]|nr:hypothetical protein [Mycobacterium sp.]
MARTHAASSDPAQDTVEYGLIVAAIAIVVLLGVVYFGDRMMSWLLTLVGRVTTLGT